MPSGTTENINELLEILNISEDLLRFNTSIEKEIRQHGGTVVYSYNNIIIASEIDEFFYAELLRNPFIESVYEVPLKQYGDLDYSLIDQFDISKLNIDINIVSGNTGLIDTGSTSGSGSGGGFEFNIAPTITNTNLTLSAGTYQQFNYKITATGMAPITFSIEKNFSGSDSIKLEGDTITGYRTVDGIADIVITATNLFGFDTKTLTLTTYKTPRITSPLIVYGTQSSAFTYAMADTGVGYSYSAYGLPSALTLTGNIISGIIGVSANTYPVVLSISDVNGFDTKTLEIRVSNSGSTGAKPIITSEGELDGMQHEELSYTIIATGPTPITYSVIGLKHGLSFVLQNGTPLIKGTPTVAEEYTATMKATNMYGVTSKDLLITIAEGHPAGGGGQV